MSLLTARASPPTFEPRSGRSGDDRQDPRPWFRCPFGPGRTIRACSAPSSDSAIARRAGTSTGSTGVRGNGSWLAREAVAAAIAHGDGAVVLLHPWTTATDLGLPAIIDGVRARGGDFVRLDALP